MQRQRRRRAQCRRVGRNSVAVGSSVEYSFVTGFFLDTPTPFLTLDLYRILPDTPAQDKARVVSFGGYA
jgi:hypothetical protein